MGKRQRREQQEESTDSRMSLEEDLRRDTRDQTPLKARNEAQGHYLLAIQSYPLVFGMGPAGTGKTFIAATMAADALLEKKVKKLIITRPVMETGESLGYLPGTMEEKFDPFFAPVKEVLVRRLGRSFTDLLIKRETIKVLPLAYMRGHTFEDAFVILDEAQNATAMQMKMFCTRIGDHSKVVINGDLTQVDHHGTSGLEDAVRRLARVRGVKVCEFTNADVVRSGLTARIVAAYDRTPQSISNEAE